MFGQTKASRQRKEADARHRRRMREESLYIKKALGVPLVPADLSGFREEFLKRMLSPEEFRMWQHNDRRPPKPCRKGLFCRLFGCNIVTSCLEPTCDECKGRCERCGQPIELPKASIER